MRPGSGSREVASMPGITEGPDPGWERGFPRQCQATFWAAVAGGGGGERDGASDDCMGMLGSSASWFAWGLFFRASVSPENA